MKLSIQILKHPMLWAISLPILVFSFSIFILSKSFCLENPNLITALTLDFILTAPVLYFLFIRKTRISPITTIPVFIIGLFLATKFIPSDQHLLIDWATYFVLPIIEISVLIGVIIQFRKTVKSFKQSDASNDFYERILSATQDVLGNNKVAHAFAFEISVFYYCFFYWKKTDLKNNQFSSFRKNGILSVYWAIIFILTIEAVAAHILLALWSPIIAWILTIGSLYLNLQIIAHAKAMKIRYTQLTEHSLEVKFGLLGASIIPFDKIDSIEFSKKTPIESGRKIEYGGILNDFEGHNVIIHLNQSEWIKRPYGIEKEFEVLCLYVDQKESFINQLNHTILKDKLNLG